MEPAVTVTSLPNGINLTTPAHKLQKFSIKGFHFVLVFTNIHHTHHNGEGGQMKGVFIKIDNCEDCVFHQIVQTTGGLRHQCNYHYNLICEYGFSAKEKPPDCKVISIVVNEE